MKTPRIWYLERKLVEKIKEWRCCAALDGLAGLSVLTRNLVSVRKARDSESQEIRCWSQRSE